MSEVNYEALKKNIIYVIKESQIKIGYSHNEISLNYPLDALNRFFGTNLNEKEILPILNGFCQYAKEELGNIKISRFEGRYCLTVSAEGVDYVHENVKDSGFLTDFIHLLSNHKKELSIDDILKVFYQYSDNVSCTKANNEEFNYVVFFKDGVPDNFIYCLDIHSGHASYHRLTRGDFDALALEF